MRKKMKMKLRMKTQKRRPGIIIRPTGLMLFAILTIYR